MNPFLQSLVNQGVSIEFLVLILLLPVLITVISFARQIIGLKGLGLYAPLMISYLFLVCGLRMGLSFFLISLLAGSFAHFALKRLRLLYLPKMGLVIIGASIIILLLAWLAGSTLSIEIIPQSALVAIIIIALGERFIAAQIERGAKVAIILITETFVLAIFGYLLAGWPWLQKIILLYPWAIVLVAIFINLLLGRWTGLRLFEYQRFKEVFRHGDFPSKK